MDEPLGTLDTEFRDMMVHELRALHDRIGATTVYVTHDQVEAMAMGDQIAIMNHGIVEQLGTPQDIYDRPATTFVADFVGTPPMNLITVPQTLKKGAKAIGLDGASVAIPESRAASAEDRIVLGVRPEHLRLNDSSKFRGEVFATEYLGTTQIVTLNTALGALKARIQSIQVLRPGERVGIDFLSDRLSVFDKESGRVIPSALHDGGRHG